MLFWKICVLSSSQGNIPKRIITEFFQQNFPQIPGNLIWFKRIMYVHTRIMSGSMTFCFFSSCNCISSFLKNDVECIDPSTAIPNLSSTVSPSSRFISSVKVGGSIPMHGTSCPYIYSDEFCSAHLETDELMSSYVRNNLEEAFRKGFEVYFCFQNPGSIKDKMNWFAFSCKHSKAPCWHILMDKWC